MDRVLDFVFLKEDSQGGQRLLSSHCNATHNREAGYYAARGLDFLPSALGSHQEVQLLKDSVCLELGGTAMAPPPLP